MAALALAFATLLILSLRGGSSGPAVSFSPVAEAAARTISVEGVRFSGTGTARGSGLPMKMSFQGVYAPGQDRTHLVMHVATPRVPQIADALNPLVEVQDGRTSYTSSPAFSSELPGGKTWMKITRPDVLDKRSKLSSSRAMDGRVILNELKKVGEGAANVGTETLQGLTTTHYVALIEPKLVAAQLRKAGDNLGARVAEAQKRPTAVDVWIDGKNLVRRVAMKVPFVLMCGCRSALEITVNYHDFGTTPHIDVPPDDAAYDATHLSRQALRDRLRQCGPGSQQSPDAQPS
jgi:hypothetical protein